MKIDIRNILETYLSSNRGGEANPVCMDEENEYRPMVDITNFLARHSLSVNPKNFEQVWEYMFGTNSDLKADLDRLSAASELNDQSALEIYNKYFDLGLDERIEKIFRDAIEQIRNTKQMIATGNDIAIKHENSLIEQADSIRGNKGGIDDAIQKLLDLSRLMVESTRENREQITQTNEKLAQLQNDLEVARNEADHDKLTRLPNRWKFDRDLTAAFQRQQDEQKPFVLAFADVDHFKRINDTFGHECGDRILRLIANELSFLSDHGCTISRYGGEEFAILAGGRDVDQIFQKIDECRARMASKSLVDVESGRPIGSVTFSVGMAESSSSDTKQSLLRKADVALYNAKSGGRNAICQYSADLEDRKGVAG